MSTLARIALGAAALLLIHLPGEPAFAQQAWVGEPGSLSLNLDYAYSRSDFVIENGDELARDEERNLPYDPTFTQSAVFSVEYTPLEKLGLVATVPVIATRYDFPGLDNSNGQLYTDLEPHGRYDDGSYHTVLQDFRLDVRYAVLNDLIGISPHLSVSIPMMDYETVGYGAAGRGLKQLIFGAAAAKYFAEGVPGLYLHGHYEFRLVEGYETDFAETAEYGQNRSVLDAFIGYFILENLDINLLGAMQIAHGGFEFEDWDDVFPGNVEEAPVVLFHDALLAESFTQLGGSLTFRPIEGLRVGASVRFFVSGQNTRNADYYGLSLGYDLL